MSVIPTAAAQVRTSRWQLTLAGFLVPLMAGCQVTFGLPNRASHDPAAPPPAVSESASPPESEPPKPPTTEPSGWEDVVAKVRNSTVRIEITTCDEKHGMGSGFVLGDHLVVTAAHVVGDASSVTLQVDGEVVAARVVEFDYGADVALLWTGQSLSPDGLDLASEMPRVGAELAVLGYPNWVQDVRVTRGIVSSVDFQVSYREFTIDDPVIVTDAAINGGNSGGPVIDRSGDVIGLVTGKQILLADQQPSEGTAYVVPSLSFAERLATWRTEDPGEGPCGAAPDDERDPITANYDSDDPDAADITQVLALHGDSINKREYLAAYELFTPDMQRRQGSVEKWSDGLDSSYWESLQVTGIERDGRRAVVEVEFRTRQKAEFGHEGQTCSDWSQHRILVALDGVWRIDAVQNDAGSPLAC